jgi:hypothetical protein
MLFLRYSLVLFQGKNLAEFLTFIIIRSIFIPDPEHAIYAA